MRTTTLTNFRSARISRWCFSFIVGVASLILLGSPVQDVHGQDYDHVIVPEGSYPYWPEYQHLNVDDLDTIEPQAWVEQNHVIHGWDWSLPEFVEPAPRSIVGLQRIIGLNKDYKPLDLKFKSNSTGILWVKWRDIEPTMGNFNFTPIINRINQANSVGSDIILRVLCHSKSRAGNISSGEAPLWLEDLGVNLLPQSDPKHNLNFDPSHPEFHKHYLMLVDELDKAGIPGMVKAAYVGYASHSFGDEGIGPYGETSSAANDTVQHVRERIDAWANAFRGMEYKMFMGAPLEYGFKKGFGFRRGFVEMYLYRIPSYNEGQYIDEEGYLCFDETSPVAKYKCFNGDVNEEYEPAWATPERDYRFGFTTNPFPYRYFTSNLRALQMRCTYIHTTGHLMPKMLPFISQELGRTYEDTPDAWSFLRTSYLSAGTYRNNDYRGRTITAEEEAEGIETKNFERWLYQRDAPGYETTPAVKIQQARKMWMVKPDKYYDYIARKGRKIGFDVDDRIFPGGEQPMVIKVTFYDGVEGTLKLVYRDNEGIQSDSVIATGTDSIRSATFVVTARMDDTGFDNGYDFILESEAEVPVVIVRVVKTKSYYRNTDMEPYGGANHTIPGMIEAEHYNVGDEGLAYLDDGVKEGDAGFRPSDAVDVIGKAGAGNDSVVSYTEDGEWLSYLVDVEEGNYSMTLYYYCGQEPGALVVSLEGQVLDTIDGLVNSGGDTRDSVLIEEIPIAAGKEQLLKLAFINGAGFDVDALRFTRYIRHVTGVELSGCPDSELMEGASKKLYAGLIPSDADDLSVTWASSDTSVAKVDAQGRVSAIAEGTATIKVTTTDGGFSDSCKISVTVLYIPVYGVTIGDCPMSILMTGDAHQLIANVAPPEATNPAVKWRTSNALVATVDSTGKIFAVSQGTSTITLTTLDGWFQETCKVGVMSTGIPATGISLSGCPEGPLVYGDSLQLGAAVLPADAGDHSVYWSSSDPSVAEVNEAGMVYALSPGSASISVTNSTGDFVDVCQLNVAAPLGGSGYEQSKGFAQVYPNPVSKELYFRFPKSGPDREIRIYNMQGQLLMTADTAQALYKMDVSDLVAENILLISIQSGGQMMNLKVLKI